MNRFVTVTSGLACRAAVLAAAGLLVAGCGPKSASSSGSGGSSAPSSPATSAPATGSGTAGTTLFPYAVGDTWVYNVSLAAEHGTTTNVITSVTPVAGGNKAVFRTHEDIPGLPTTPTSLAYIFHPGGSITVPYVQTGNGTVTIKSGSIVWPSQAALDSGQPTKSTLVFTITAGGTTTTTSAHVTVQGGGVHSVTVPAGTYQATIVNETIGETIEGTQVTFVVRTWLAPGVGPVKSEILTGTTTASKAGTIDVLKSFTKG